MTRYRIVPTGADWWKVQQRFLFLWLDCTVNTGPDYWEVVSFDTEGEAETWIERQHDLAAQRAILRAKSSQRSALTGAREYPPSPNQEQSQ